MLKSNRTVYHSIFPPGNRWAGFFFILTNFRAYFAINISTKVWLEPVKVSLRCQLLIRILIVLPLCEHIIDQPDASQVSFGFLHHGLYPPCVCFPFRCLYITVTGAVYQAAMIHDHSPTVLSDMCISCTRKICRNERKPPAGSLRPYLSARSGCTIRWRVRHPRRPHPKSSAVPVGTRSMKALPWGPQRIRKPQPPRRKLQDAVVARTEQVVVALDADAVFREVVQMLLHGEILRVFHSVGSFPFGMHILPSLSHTIKRL